MKLLQHISMDFAVHGITPKIYGKQDDSGGLRAVAVSLYNDGAGYPFSEDTGFMLRYKTAAGAIGLYDVLPNGTSAFSVDGNTVTVTLVDQIFAMPGNVECELRVIEPETVVTVGNTTTQSSGTVSTWAWIVEVERSNVGDATIPSDYINVLSGYAATAVQAAAVAKEFANSLDTSSLMKLADYDAAGVVRAAGGIAAYVSENKVTVVDSVTSTSKIDAASAAAVKLAYDTASEAMPNNPSDGEDVKFFMRSADNQYMLQPKDYSCQHIKNGKIHFISFSGNYSYRSEYGLPSLYFNSNTLSCGFVFAMAESSRASFVVDDIHQFRDCIATVLRPTISSSSTIIDVRLSLVDPPTSTPIDDSNISVSFRLLLVEE